MRIARRDPRRATMLEAYESIYAYRQEEYITRQGFSGTGNLAMCREAYDVVGPFCGIERAEDRDWGQRARRHGIVTRYIPEMIVHHPARRSFAELKAKWDRHISHDFQEYAALNWGGARWMLCGVAIAFSPIVEVSRVWGSGRVNGASERLSALAAVTRIRAWRALRMFKLSLTLEPSASSRSWNGRS